MSKLFARHFDVFTSEADPVLAEAGVAANLKLIDVFIAEEPDNKTLLALAAKSYALYAFFFIEGKILEHQGTEKEKFLIERAKVGYKKAILYGKQALKADHPQIFTAFNENETSLKKALSGRDINIDSVFWLAYAIGAYSHINPNDSKVLIDLEKAKILMNVVLNQDETFFYGAPHLFFAVYYSSTPTFAGGNPGKAKEHFQAALRITQGKLLLVPYFNARYYAAAVLDRELFEKKLKLVLEAPDDLLPPLRLGNIMAKHWAGVLLKKADYIF